MTVLYTKFVNTDAVGDGSGWDATNGYVSLSAAEAAEQGNLNNVHQSTVTVTTAFVSSDANESLAFSVSGATGRLVYANGTTLIYEVLTGTPVVTDVITGLTGSVTVSSIDDITGAKITFQCLGSVNDNIKTLVSGWTATATNNVNIVSTGAFEANHYSIHTGGTGVIEVSVSNTVIDGIEIGLTGSNPSDECIRINSGVFDVAIRRSLLWTGTTTASKDGIYTGNWACSGTIDSCIIYGFPRCGIHIQNYSSSAEQYWTLKNNVVTRCGLDGGSVGGIGTRDGAGTSVTQVTMYNNVSFDNIGFDYVETGGSNTTWLGSHNADSDNTLATRVATNAIHNIVSANEFTDATNNDFTLLQSSQFVGAGSNLSGASFDIIGNSNPDNGLTPSDIGAYHLKDLIRFLDPDATGTGDGLSLVNAYTSLSAAEAAEQRDYAAQKRTLLINAQSSAGSIDSPATNILGNTTTPIYNITIKGDFADTKYNTTNYRLEATAPSTTGTLRVQDDNVNIQNLQVRNTETDISYRYVAHIEGSDCHVRDSLFTDDGSIDNNRYGILNNNTTGTNTFENIIVIAGTSSATSYGAGIRHGGGGAATLKNSTILPSDLVNNQGYGIRGAFVCENVYCGGFSYGHFYQTGALTNCASGDTTGSAGLQSIPFDTTTFTNVTTGSVDVALAQGSALISAGSVSATASNDIVGNARPNDGLTPLDIGAVHLKDLIRYVDSSVIGGTGDGTSLVNAYTSASAAEAAEQRDFTAENRTIKFLLQNTGIANPDTGRLIVSGSTLSVSNDMTWEQVDATPLVWDAAAYVLQDARQGSFGTALNIQDTNVTTNNLQVEQQDSTGSGITCSALSGIHNINNCIGRQTDIATGGAGLADSTGNDGNLEVIATNNIFDSFFRGVQNQDAVWRLANNTAANSIDSGFYGFSYTPTGGGHIANNLAVGSGDVDFKPANNIAAQFSHDFNATGDASITETNGLTNVAVAFKGPTDWHVVNSAPDISQAGAGTGNAAYGPYIAANDTDGNARPTGDTASIGADEFVNSGNTLLFSDFFTAADGTAATVYGPYTAITGLMDINANGLASDSVAAESAIYRNDVIPTADQFVEVAYPENLSALGASIYSGGALRCSTIGVEYIGFYVNASGRIFVFETTTGSGQNVLQDQAALVSGGDVVRMEVEGTEIRIYLNGVLQTLLTSTATLTIGRIGFCGYGDDPSFNTTNISYAFGGDLPAANGTTGTGSHSLTLPTSSGIAEHEITGSGAHNLVLPTSSGAGTVTGSATTGTGSHSLTLPVSSGVGEHEITGSGSHSLTTATSVGTAENTISGLGNHSLALSTSIGIGEREIAGTGSHSLALSTSVGTAENTISGSGSHSLALSISSGIAERSIDGLGNHNLVLPISSGTGATTGITSGSGSHGLILPVSSGIAERSIDGLGSHSLTLPTSVGIAENAITGSGNHELIIGTSTGIAERIIDGLGSHELVTATSVGTAENEITGSGSHALITPTSSGVGVLFGATTGSGSHSLTTPISSGIAEREIAGTGSHELVVAISSGTGAGENVITGSGNHELVVAISSGIAERGIDGIGSHELATPTSVGTAENEITGSGSHSIALALIAGIGEHEITGTGNNEFITVISNGVGERSIDGSGSHSLVVDSVGIAEHIITGSGSHALINPIHTGIGIIGLVPVTYITAGFSTKTYDTQFKFESESKNFKLESYDVNVTFNSSKEIYFK